VGPSVETGVAAYLNPYFKQSAYKVQAGFDLREPETQRYLERWCVQLQESTLVKRVKPRKCVISDFRAYQESRAQPFPVASPQFETDFANFLASTGYVHMTSGLIGFDEKDPCKVLFIGVAVRASFKKSTGSWQMIDVYEDWEDFVDRGNDIAPPALADGFATSDKFVSMATQVEAVSSTSLSIWIACMLVVLIIIAVTGSIQMALLILLNLLVIVMFVVAGLSALGMEFGGIEAIALTILIGMSCDYCLHLADTFLTSRAQSRSKRIMEAISHLGPTIFSAAGTSLLASVPTALFCDILILSNFGTIMCLSIVCGVAFGILFFCPICVLLGPRYACRTWKDTVMLSLFGSPLHVVSSLVFFAFVIMTLTESGRDYMEAHITASLTFFAAAMSLPVLVGINVPPAGAFKHNAVELKY